MCTIFAVFFLVTLSTCSEDGLKSVEGGPSFALTGDRPSHLAEKEQGVSTRADVLVFTLKLQVKNAVSHQPLSQASVEVFANYTLIISTKTSHDGSSVLDMPYIQGMALTLVASKDGYIQTALPWKTTKRPIYSSVTLSLFSQNQGNIWLFEDSVLITGKTSDSTPQPSLQFPKSLLTLPESNISFLTAYMSGPQLPAEQHCIPHTTGIIVSKSGYRSIELNPVAAVSVQLLHNGEYVQVTGPIQITLPLPESSQAKLSDTIPAWSFSRKTGAWVNRGLGVVKTEDSRLVWVYVAPHLGFWIAAPFPLHSGYLGQESNLDFISYHTYLLMATLAGTLMIVIGLFGVVSCYCRDSLRKPERRRVSTTVQKKDQTTCTNNNDHLDVYFKDPEPGEDSSYLDASQGTCQRDQPVNCENKGNVDACEEKSVHSAFKICETLGGMAADSSSPSQQLPLYVNNGGTVMAMSLNENMRLPERFVFYNHPVSILKVPDHFSLSPQASGSRSATLPRTVQYKNLEMPVSTNTQTLSKTPIVSEETQSMEPYGDLGLSSSPGGWSCFKGLLESVSVPGTLNEAAGMDRLCGNHQGTSEQTLLELSKSKPFPHPKAWFVSLEGKPAAQVRHSIVDLRRSHLLNNSNDTSLDSGVDLNEHKCSQKSSMGHSHPLCLEDVDLSSSESGTTAACSPEEPAPKSTLHSSRRTISNLSEHRQHADVSSTHEATERASSSRVHREKGQTNKHHVCSSSRKVSRAGNVAFETYSLGNC